MTSYSWPSWARIWFGGPRIAEGIDTRGPQRRNPNSLRHAVHLRVLAHRKVLLNAAPGGENSNSPQVPEDATTVGIHAEQALRISAANSPMSFLSYWK